MTVDRPGGDDRGPDGLIRAILDLLAEVDARGERHERGRWVGDRTTVDYSVSVGGLDEAFGASLPGDRGTDPIGESRIPAVTVRESDDELLVVADLPEARDEDVTADLDRAERSVEIALNGDVVGHVPLDDDWLIVDLSVNNGIVEVRLSRE